MQVRTVIFDLDGTLVDSLPGIEASTRHAIAACLPGRALPPLRDLIGPPIATMLGNVWPDLPEPELERVVAAFRAHYDAEGCRLSAPYPHVREVLDELKANGIAMHVLTNKPLQPTLSILELNGIRPHFGDVISPDSVQPAFTAKVEGARLLRDRHQLEPAATLVVGDGLDDLKAAESCGFSFAVAAFGYGSATRSGNAAAYPQMKTFPELLRLVL
jgi:phosphoglycolate phosphatase